MRPRWQIRVLATSSVSAYCKDSYTSYLRLTWVGCRASERWLQAARSSEEDKDGEIPHANAGLSGECNRQTKGAIEAPYRLPHVQVVLISAPHLYGAWKENIVFQVDVLVKIGLEVL